MKYDRQGVAFVSTIAGGPFGDEKSVTVFLAKRIGGGDVARQSGAFAWILGNQTRDQLVSCAAGVVARVWHKAITGKDLEWPDAAVLPIGERRVRVRLTRRMLGPTGFDFDSEADTLWVQTSSLASTVVSRTLAGCDVVLSQWHRRVLRRALRRERPRLDLSAAQEPATPRPARKPRPRPGELLAQHERDAILAEGDAVLRSLLEPPVDVRKADAA